MKKTFSNDKTYVSHAVLSYGDYDNSCAAELERKIETVLP